MLIVHRNGSYGIDKREIDGCISAIDSYVKPSTYGRREKIIVSLTSYPARIGEIKYTLYSLLTQDFPADEVVLWLTEEEFPAGEKSLPSYMKLWEKYGLKIRWTRNKRSYTKLLPALEFYKNAVIVTADDDIYYSKGWLRCLYETHVKYPEDIVAHRVRRVILGDKGVAPYVDWPIISEHCRSHRNFLTGVGGVLYPINCMHEDINKQDLWEELSPSNDDIWFWAMAVINGRKITVPINDINRLIYTDSDMQQEGKTLWRSNIYNNDECFKRVISIYPQIMDRLQAENNF